LTVDFNNKADVSKSFKEIDDLTQDFYMSVEYNRFWDRYVSRWKAYHRRHATNAPKWRSKLYFATFFMAIKALDAHFKAQHATDPFIFVDIKDNSTPNPESKKIAQAAHADLNYDLEISNFKSKLFDMYYFVELVGTAVAREYIRSQQIEDTSLEVEEDEFGNNAGFKETEDIQRQEYTATDVIHPLNFAHDVTKKNFIDSEWGSVRFELPAKELMAMKGNENYLQDGVRKTIEQWESGKGLGFITGQTTFYSERGDDDVQQRKNTLVVDEYYGPLRYQGNRDDNTLYYALIVKSNKQVLALRKSPFPRIPYWKMMTYPEPDGPYGIGASDTLLPINYWENSTVNQYNDYMNSSMKYLYEASHENIIGGINALINGRPGGLVLRDKTVAPGTTINALNVNKAQVPVVESMLQRIEASKNQSSVATNLNSQQEAQAADTATGIGLIANRQDKIISAVQDDIDEGIKDGMQIKQTFQFNFFTEPREAEVDGELIPHYPFQLKGQDYAFNIKRELGDVEAGKNLSYLRLLMETDNFLTQKGTPMPAKSLVALAKKIGQGLAIDGVDEIFSEIEQQAQQPQAPQPEIPGAAPGAPSPEPTGAINAGAIV
jgi:hypothetical protein